MIRYIALIMLSFLMTACAVGPEYSAPPEVDLGKGWVASDAQSDQSLPDRWWEMLGDATLTRLIEQGLSHNLDVRMAVARIDEARARQGVAESALIPAVGSHASDTMRRQSRNGPLPIGKTPGINRDQTIYDIGLDAAWEIDLFGRVRNGVTSAKAQIEASEADAAAIRLSVAAEIARSYFTLRGNQQQRHERLAAIGTLEQTLKLVYQRVEAGDLPAIEAERISAQLDAINTSLSLLDGQIRAATLALGTLLGGLPEQALHVVSEEGETLALPDIPLGQRADLLRRRPDIRASERRLAVSTAGIALEMAEQFPKLTIAAGGGFQSLTPTTLLDGGSQTLALTPLISWRIFDGGRIKAEIRTSEARQRSAALGYEKSVLTAIGEAERALSNYHYARAALAQQQRAISSATSIFIHQQQRFAAGDISMLELLDAQRQLHQTTEAGAQLHLNASLALISAYRTLGGGWQSSQ